MAFGHKALKALVPQIWNSFPGNTKINSVDFKSIKNGLALNAWGPKCGPKYVFLKMIGHKNQKYR